VKRSKQVTFAAGLGALLGIVGCSTEPAGGKLPPPGPVKTAEEAKADFSQMTGKMYGEMAKGGTAGAPGPKQK
jgi:hypothetical protein